MKKPELVAGLIATKGSAIPAGDMPTRAPAATVSKGEGATLKPLNFAVPADFRRTFKTYAASHDLKQNELLFRAFEAYRKQQGD